MASFKRSAGYYEHRHSDPRIAAAFGRRDPAEDGLAGAPTLDDLMAMSAVSSFLSSFRQMPRVERGLKALRGVTIELSVSFFGEGKEPIAVARWRAGEGSRFELLRPLS